MVLGNSGYASFSLEGYGMANIKAAIQISYGGIGITADFPPGTPLNTINDEFKMIGDHIGKLIIQKRCGN